MVKYTTLSQWPQYNMTSQNYLSFRNKRDEIGQYLYAREINFWRNIIPGVMDVSTKHEAPQVVNVFYENVTDATDGSGLDSDTRTYEQYDTQDSSEDTDDVDITVEDDDSDPKHTELWDYDMCIKE